MQEIYNCGGGGTLQDRKPRKARKRSIINVQQSTYLKSDFRFQYTLHIGFALVLFLSGALAWGNKDDPVADYYLHTSLSFLSFEILDCQQRKSQSLLIF